MKLLNKHIVVCFLCLMAVFSYSNSILTDGILTALNQDLGYMNPDNIVVGSSSGEIILYSLSQKKRLQDIKTNLGQISWISYDSQSLKFYMVIANLPGYYTVTQSGNVQNITLESQAVTSLARVHFSNASGTIVSHSNGEVYFVPDNGIAVDITKDLDSMIINGKKYNLNNGEAKSIRVVRGSDGSNMLYTQFSDGKVVINTITNNGEGLVVDQYTVNMYSPLGYPNSNGDKVLYSGYTYPTAGDLENWYFYAYYTIPQDPQHIYLYQSLLNLTNWHSWHYQALNKGDWFIKSKPALVAGHVNVGIETFYMIVLGTTRNIYTGIIGSQLQDLSLATEAISPMNVPALGYGEDGKKSNYMILKDGKIYKLGVESWEVTSSYYAAI